MQKDPKTTQEMLRVIKKYNPQDPRVTTRETPAPTDVAAPIEEGRRREMHLVLERATEKELYVGQSKRLSG